MAKLWIWKRFTKLKYFPPNNLEIRNDKSLKTIYFEPQKDAGALRAGEGGQWDPDENQPQERVRTKYNDQW